MAFLCIPMKTGVKSEHCLKGARAGDGADHRARDVGWGGRRRQPAKATANIKLRILSKRDIDVRAARCIHAPSATSVAANRSARLAPKGHARSQIGDAPSSVPPSADLGIAQAA